MLHLKIGDWQLDLAIPIEKRIPGPSPLPPRLTDVEQAVSAVLENPEEFPPLRRALTPDDHVAVLVQEDVNQIEQAVSSVLRHILSAGVQLEHITLLVPPRPPGAWTLLPEQLPAELRQCPLEVHDPAASHMAYLASTPQGRRIYLNRTLVDADQLVILGSVRFDAYFGSACGLADLFPAFSNLETQHELWRTPHLDAFHARKHHPLWDEAEKVGWLLGMPFVVTLLEGSGTDVLEVAAGAAGHVRKRMDARLRQVRQFSVSSPVDLVIGSCTLPLLRQTFSQLMQAGLHGSRVTRHQGAVVLHSQAGSEFPLGAELMRQAEQPTAGLSRIRHDFPGAALPWWQLATALEQAKLYIHSRMAAETLEELWIIPMTDPQQVQPLIHAAQSVLVVEDLHRVMPTLA